MKSYKEIIKGDVFKKKNSYFVNTAVNKMCWGCESKHTAGFMVLDSSKNRRIFFCQNCYDKNLIFKSSSIRMNVHIT